MSGFQYTPPEHMLALQPPSIMACNYFVTLEAAKRSSQPNKSWRTLTLLAALRLLSTHLPHAMP